MSFLDFNAALVERDERLRKAEKRYAQNGYSNDAPVATPIPVEGRIQRQMKHLMQIMTHRQEVSDARRAHAI